MLIYICIIVFISLLFMMRRVLPSKLTNILLFLFLIFITLVQGLRYDVGTDFKLYENIYNRNLAYIESSVEIGYLWFNKILSDMGFTLTGFLLITAFIINFNYFKGAKLISDDKILTVFLFVTSGIYFSGYNIVRQAIVMSIIFLALYLLLKKKNILFVLTIIVGFFFHRSVIFTLLFLFLGFIKIKPTVFIISLIFLIGFLNTPLATSFLNFAIDLAPDKYDMYENLIANSEGVNLFNLFLPSVLLILILSYYYRLIERNRNNVLYINIFFAYYMFLLVSIEFLSVYRIAAYFELVILLIIPELLKLSRIREKWFFDLLIVIFFSAFIIIKLYLGHYGVYPYQTK
ncbi:biofilm extracellular matrix formation enzyme [Niallia circulans]|uniref:EpsG family protein n=1 Tax=Shouchella clausii TaxID=79880 RepID=UPI000BA5777E|nr:EpsG family protein [Shouchella clausii]PAD44027.1 hypothetical protein CHH54_04125 [Bacillus sp. 7520-S]PAE98483.1 hypothetical protein CHH71_03970 [Shouchella clausii]PAF13758.1 hypothetical protein CHH59_11975 [Shouchella clausii]SPT78312.1 biofilm extracellular matrix formation enzyme [Niallia circulans]